MAEAEDLMRETREASRNPGNSRRTPAFGTAVIYLALEEVSRLMPVHV